MEETFTTFDLTTFGGIMIATTALVGVVKHMWPTWAKGKEPLLALIIPVCLGLLAKFTMDAFEDMHLVNLAVGLFMSGLGAGLVHDNVVKPIMQKKVQAPYNDG